MPRKGNLVKVAFLALALLAAASLAADRVVLWEYATQTG
jgi:hypothetical protein